MTKIVLFFYLSRLVDKFHEFYFLELFYEIFHFNGKKEVFRVDLGQRVGHCNGCVKFECNNRCHCIQKTILNGDFLST